MRRQMYGGGRPVDSAAHLVDEVFPERPIRQWVLSVPYQLRFLFATEPQVITKVLAIVHRVITTWLIKRAGLTVKSGAQAGAVTLIQHFGSALNAKCTFTFSHALCRRCVRPAWTILSTQGAEHG